MLPPAIMNKLYRSDTPVPASYAHSLRWLHYHAYTENESTNTTIEKKNDADADWNLHPALNLPKTVHQLNFINTSLQMKES